MKNRLPMFSYHTNLTCIKLTYLYCLKIFVFKNCSFTFRLESLMKTVMNEYLASDRERISNSFRNSVEHTCSVLCGEQHFSLKNYKTKISVSSENVEEALYPTVLNIEPRLNSLHKSKPGCPFQCACVTLFLIKGNIICRTNNFTFLLDLFILCILHMQAHVCGHGSTPWHGLCGGQEII